MQDEDDGRARPRKDDLEQRARQKTRAASAKALKSFRAANIPAALRAIPHWVPWRWSVRDGAITKVPYCAEALGMVRARVNDPDNWSTFHVAYGRWQQCPRAFCGVGFILGPHRGRHIVGIDLDGVVDPDTAVMHPVGQEIVDKARSYVETSPSGTGVKIFGYGRPFPELTGTPTGCKLQPSVNGVLIPGTKRTPGGTQGVIEIEAYWERRLFCVTGAGGGKLADIGDLMRDLILEIRVSAKQQQSRRQSNRRRPELRLTDRDLINRILGSRGRQRFEAICQGRDLQTCYGGDESRRDCGLASLLAWWTKDPDQIERIMRRTEIARAKWDERPEWLRTVILEQITRVRG